MLWHINLHVIHPQIQSKSWQHGNTDFQPILLALWQHPWTCYQPFQLKTTVLVPSRAVNEVMRLSWYISTSSSLTKKCLVVIIRQFYILSSVYSCWLYALMESHSGQQPRFFFGHNIYWRKKRLNTGQHTHVHLLWWGVWHLDEYK